MSINSRNIENYYSNLKVAIDNVEATNRSFRKMCFKDAVNKAFELILRQSLKVKKLILIGNGASASISSHIATDFWKNCGIKALSFNDSSLLTCISNDYGYEYVFQKPIEMFSEPGDVLIAISSSGESENIIRATKIAKLKRLKIITLSGFSKKNRLRKLGNINFYVPDHKYGFVEVVHTAICHCWVDMFTKRKGKKVL